LSARERILMIRLLDKVSKHPMYAKALGVEGVQRVVSSGDLDLSDASESSRSQ